MPHRSHWKISCVLGFLIGACLGHLLAMGQLLWSAWQRRHETGLLWNILLNSPWFWIAVLVLLGSVAAWAQISRQEAQEVV